MEFLLVLTNPDLGLDGGYYGERIDAILASPSAFGRNPSLACPLCFGRVSLVMDGSRSWGVELKHQSQSFRCPSQGVALRSDDGSGFEPPNALVPMERSLFGRTTQAEAQSFRDAIARTGIRDLRPVRDVLALAVSLREHGSGLMDRPFVAAGSAASTLRKFTVDLDNADLDSIPEGRRLFIGEPLRLARWGDSHVCFGPRRRRPYSCSASFAGGRLAPRAIDTLLARNAAAVARLLVVGQATEMPDGVRIVIESEEDYCLTLNGVPIRPELLGCYAP